MASLAMPLVASVRREIETEMERDASTHVPVMLEQVVDYLRPRDGGCYVDATLGGGGHTAAILEASAPSGRVLAIERDPESAERTGARLGDDGSRLSIAVGSFARLSEHLAAAGIDAADGIVADLGLSSDQLDDPERGFAFSSDGPLDMRFDRSTGPSALDLVNDLDPETLADVLYRYGEERRSRAIARRIVDRRPIRTTKELRSAVVSVLGPRRRGADPATRTFQALRIEVNDELGALETLLEVGPPALAPGGRLVILSYHSLEDRAVKHSFRARGSEGYSVVTKKPVVAEPVDIESNPRARSAKLRVLERNP